MNLGSDIRIKGSFFGHYKTLKLAKLATWEAPIRLQQLWFFASDNRPDGNLTGMDDDDIALASGWMHETRTFVEALLSCGWLDGEPGARSLHDYTEHQPWVLERLQRAVRGAEGGKKAAEHMTDKQRRERASKGGAARWGANQTPSECLDDAKDTKHPVSTDAKRPKHTMLSPIQTNTNPVHPLISPVPGEGVESYSAQGENKEPKPPKPKPLRIAPSSEFDWPATKKFLESTLEPDLYARWIEPLTYEGMSERGAVLVAADQFAANYVSYNLREPLGDAILVAHGLAVPFCCLSRSGLAGAGS